MLVVRCVCGVACIFARSQYCIWGQVRTCAAGSDIIDLAVPEGLDIVGFLSRDLCRVALNAERDGCTYRYYALSLSDDTFHMTQAVSLYRLVLSMMRVS